MNNSVDEPAVRLRRSDFATAALAAMLAMGLSLYLSARLDPAIYGSGGFNVWFQADPPRVLRAMTDGASRYHYRTSVHPLFSLLTTPPTRALIAMGVAPVTAGRALIAAGGFLSAGFLFLALRGLDLPRPVAMLWIAVLLASATYLHWFCLIETYAFGAASICLMLCVLTCARATSGWLWCIASAATLSVTVTNWMLGLSATLFRLGWRRMMYVTLAAGIAVVGLSVAQRAWYPQARYFFIPSAILNEHQYAQVHRTSGIEGWKPLTDARAMLLTSAVAPKPEVVPGDQAGGHEDEQIMTNQHSPIASYGPAGWIAGAAWAVTVVVGFAGGWGAKERRPVFLAVLTYLIGELALNLVYGPITFLYATNFFPALIMLGGFGWFSRFRLVSVGAATVFVLFGALANAASFNEAVRLANGIILGGGTHRADPAVVSQHSVTPP